MTNTSFAGSVRAAAASAAATALLLVSVLAVQRARAGWPFDIDTPDTEMSMPNLDGDASRASHDRTAVDTASTNTLDLKIETVARSTLRQTVRAVATISPDETRISHAHTRVAGWVEQLFVNTTGESVRAGQPLLSIFSQELLSSQAEYLAARAASLQSGITTAVVSGGRTRLTVLGMTAREIDEIEATGQPRRLVTVVAPRSGIVINRGVTVGTSVDPSTPLLTVADLSHVWVLAEVPESAISLIRVGSSAEVDFPASGRPPFRARVEFVYPTVTERTRTLRVRMTAANGSGALRPGLFGSAAFDVDGDDVISVPRDAVVDTGRQQHVFVLNGDRFEPRVVTVGVQLADRIEIREGLKEGEQIVAAGVFLLDSESRLRATGGAGGHSHGYSSQEQDAPAKSVDPHANHKG